MNRDYVDDHVQAVFAWLDEHVLKLDTPQHVTLFDIHVDATTYKGSFRLQLDDVVLDATRLEDPFRFALGDNGKPTLYYPMFHSPLGAPASYGAIELTPETEQAIQRALDTLLPPMRPLGLDKATGRLLTYGTPIEERLLDAVDYHQRFQALAGARHLVSLHG